MQIFDHNRPDFEPYGFTCELWTAAPMRRPDRHNEIELNLMKNGSLTYLFGGKRITVPRGGLGVFWAAIPHQIVGSSGDREYYVATLPLAWVLQRQLPEKLVDRLLQGKFLYEQEPRRFELDLRLFHSWVDEMVDGLDTPQLAIRLELHARLQRFADALPALDRNAEDNRAVALIGEGDLGRVERMAAFVAKNCRLALRVEEIAQVVGLHPNYAMSLFKKTLGLTINEYLTQHRMSYAQRLLATTDHKVIDIAGDAGYPTLSRFYEAFRKYCGCSPSDYRRDHRFSR